MIDQTKGVAECDQCEWRELADLTPTLRFIAPVGWTYVDGWWLCRDCAAER